MSDPRVNHLPHATDAELDSIHNHASAEFAKALSYLLSVNAEMVVRIVKNKGLDDPRLNYAAKTVSPVSGGISDD